MQLIMYLVYVLLWPDDSCLTAETCGPDVTDIVNDMGSHRVQAYIVPCICSALA